MKTVGDYAILDIMNPYEYATDDFQFNLQLKKENTAWRHYLVDFPAAFTTRHKEHHTVRGEYFQPKETDRAPLVIMLHGVGDHSVAPCKSLARNLAKQGVASMVLYMVVHSRRRPKMMQKSLIQLDADEWFEMYQTSVIEVRQVVDWAYKNVKIDEERIAVFGISFGGLVSSIAMGVDERIQAGIFFVSGGNSGKIAQKSRAGMVRRNYRSSEAEYKESQDTYASYLTEVVENGFENVVPPNSNFLIDPMTFAHYLRQRPVLMINARWDVFIPREATEDLWRQCGQPEIVWFTAGHTSIWLWYLAIKRRVGDFIRTTFGM